MDDNTQVKPVQNPAPTQQPDPTQSDDNQNTSSDDNQISTAAPQTTARPVEKPGKQQISVPGHLEQGPVGSFVANEEPDDNDDDDEQPVAKQEVSNIKMSHPEIVLPPEVKDAGVTEGRDAKKENLPEEKQEIPEETVQTAGQVTTQQAGDTNLPMSYGEAQLAARKERSIKKGISWIIRTVIREWKKKFFNESTDKSTNQQIN